MLPLRTSGTLRTYRINSLDITGRIAFAHEIACRDDLDALAEGERCCADNALEIWDGARLVARIKQGNIPLNAQDHHSL